MLNFQNHADKESRPSSHREFKVVVGYIGVCSVALEYCQKKSLLQLNTWLEHMKVISHHPAE
jgi:hypothetical protein